MGGGHGRSWSFHGSPWGAHRRGEGGAPWGGLGPSPAVRELLLLVVSCLLYVRNTKKEGGRRKREEKKRKEQKRKKYEKFWGEK
jgi:hypothetical protein